MGAYKMVQQNFCDDKRSNTIKDETYPSTCTKDKKNMWLNIPTYQLTGSSQGQKTITLAAVVKFALRRPILVKMKMKTS